MRERSTRDQRASAHQSSNIDPNNIHQNPPANNRFTGGEHSVERLKSCIADLKKLATSKVKKTSAVNSQSINNQYEKYESRYGPAGNNGAAANNGGYSRVQSSHNTNQAHSSNYHSNYSQKQQSSINQKNSRQSSSNQILQSSNQRPSYGQGASRQTHAVSSSQVHNSNLHPQTHGNHGPERKQHQTKIANALKKYIHDIDYTGQNSQTNIIDSSRDNQDRGIVNHSQIGANQRSATTKKPRPQSGKPQGSSGLMQPSYSESNQTRGGSVKREMYGQSGNHPIATSSNISNKYGQKSKLGGTTQSTRMNGTGYSSQSYGGFGTPAQKQPMSNTVGNKKSSTSVAATRDTRTTGGQRKAASSDTRDKYGQPMGYGQQKRSTDQRESERLLAVEKYNSSKKNLTQQVQPKDARPGSNVQSSSGKPSQPGYLISQQQPRSNSTSYLQKQNNYLQSSSTQGQTTHGSSYNLAPNRASDSNRQNQLGNKNQMELNKYQNYTKVLSERPAFQASSHNSSQAQQRQSQPKGDRQVNQQYAQSSKNLTKHEPVYNSQVYTKQQLQISNQRSSDPSEVQNTQFSPSFNQQLDQNKTPLQIQFENQPKANSKRAHGNGSRMSGREDQSQQSQASLRPSQVQQEQKLSRLTNATSDMQEVTSKNEMGNRDGSVQNPRVNSPPQQQLQIHHLSGNSPKKAAQNGNFSLANFKPSSDVNRTQESLGNLNSSDAKAHQFQQQSFDKQDRQSEQMGGGPNMTKIQRPSNQNSLVQNNLYSLQQAAAGQYNNSLSLSANQNQHGNNTLNHNTRGIGTLIVTREDFNIEDIHCQMVYKVQRNNQLLREIEGLPNEKEDNSITDIVARQEKSKGRAIPLLVDEVEDDEIICGDMCVKAAITWGRGKRIAPKIKLLDDGRALVQQQSSHSNKSYSQSTSQSQKHNKPPATTNNSQHQKNKSYSSSQQSSSGQYHQSQSYNPSQYQPMVGKNQRPSTAKQR